MMNEKGESGEGQEEARVNLQHSALADIAVLTLFEV